MKLTGEVSGNFELFYAEGTIVIPREPSADIAKVILCTMSTFRIVKLILNFDI